MKSKFLMLSPLTLGFIVAGALFFVIFAVVRNATADTGKVEAITAQQYAAFQAAVAQQSGSNASDALPAFSLATETPEVYHPTLPPPIAQGVQPLIWYDATAIEAPTATATPVPTSTPWPTIPPPTQTPMPSPTTMATPQISCYHIAISNDGRIFALDYSPQATWFNTLSDTEKRGIVEWCGGQHG